MDELPIILVSNDLKYAMTPLKIKTFQRAREYYYTQRQAVESGQVQIEQLVGVSDKLQKIKKYMQKYNTVREEVWKKVQFCHVVENQPEQAYTQPTSNYPFHQREVFIPRYEDSSDEEKHGQIAQKILEVQNTVEEKKQNTFNNSRESNYSGLSFDFDLKHKAPVFKEEWDKTQVKNVKRQSFLQQKNTDIHKTQPKNLFEKSIVDSSIVEIYGEKSVGKTALLLYFCQKYAQSSSKKIYFINCGGGVTYKRFQRLQKNCPNLEYRDSYILDHILGVCKSAALDPETGCIAVDSLTNLLMEEQKTLIFLIKMFKIFSYLLTKGCKVILTNYLQQSFDHSENDQLTNHYSYYCAVTSQFMTYKYYLSELENSEKVVVKMCRGGFVQAEYDICDDGVGELVVKQGGREI